MNLDEIFKKIDTFTETKLTKELAKQVAIGLTATGDEWKVYEGLNASIFFENKEDTKIVIVECD